MRITAGEKSNPFIMLMIDDGNGRCKFRMYGSRPGATGMDQKADSMGCGQFFCLSAEYYRSSLPVIIMRIE